MRRGRAQIISGQYAVRWDATNLYVAAHIVVPMLQGDNATTPYENDAIEFYLSGDTPITGDYDKQSHQYIVDWHNLVVDYGPTNYPPSMAATNPPNFTSQVKVVTGGWQIEAAIAWTALVDGKAPTAGAKIALDVAFDDGDGTTLNTQILAIWRHATALLRVQDVLLRPDADPTTRTATRSASEGSRCGSVLSRSACSPVA